MKILVLSAVISEIQYLENKLENFKSVSCSYSIAKTGLINNNEIFILTTGVGSVNTAGALTLAIEIFKPDLIIQTGIGGAFRKNLIELGDIGIATSETDIHLGLESGTIKVDPLPFDLYSSKGNDNFKNRIELDLILANEAKNILDTKFSTFSGSFISVSTITTSDTRALDLYNNYSPLIESMEGFSAAQISQMCGISYVQIRSASNYVENRNRESWKITKACKNCANAVYEYIINK